jgi:hypothetical protein
MNRSEDVELRARLHTHHRHRHGRNACRKSYSLQCRGRGEGDVDTKVQTQVGSKVAFPNALLSSGSKKTNQPRFPANLCMPICMCSFSSDRKIHLTMLSLLYGHLVLGRICVGDSYLSDCSALSHRTVQQTESPDPRLYELSK